MEKQATNQQKQIKYALREIFVFFYVLRIVAALVLATIIIKGKTETLYSKKVQNMQCQCIFHCSSSNSKGKHKTSPSQVKRKRMKEREKERVEKSTEDRGRK